MAGLAWSAPVSCVALLMRGTHAAQRGHAPNCEGAYGVRIRTRLYFKCYCACRRHQGCHCRETETSVRLRFLGSSRTSRCLPVSGHMGCGAQRAMPGRKLKRWAPSSRIAVVSSSIGLGRRKRF